MIQTGILYSQDTCTQNIEIKCSDVVYNNEMDSIALECLSTQQFKDTLINSQHREINVLKQSVLTCEGSRVELREKNKELIEYNNSLNRKKIRNLKIGALLGLIIGLSTQFIF